MSGIDADAFSLPAGLGSPVAATAAAPKRSALHDDTFSLHLPDISLAALAAHTDAAPEQDASSLKISNISPQRPPARSAGSVRTSRSLMGLSVKMHPARGQSLSGLLGSLSSDEDDHPKKRKRDAVDATVDVETNANSSADQDANPPGVPPADVQYDAPRKKVKRRASRIARPRDSMPGFSRPRGGGGGRWRGRKSGRGGRSSRDPGGTSVAIGAGYLDRGSSRAAYFGGAAGAAGGDAGTETGAAECIMAEEADIAEKTKLAQRDGDLGTLSALAVPVCPAHNIPCRQAVTKKGKNKGRPFFACGHATRYQQCDFFAWADEKAPVLGVDDFGEFAGCSAEEFTVAKEVVQCDDPTSVDLDEVAKEYFGFDDLRDGQRSAVDNLRKGNSTLAIFATGGGKSLVYQMYAALFPGVVLVVTPLVSLMRDQEERMPSCLPCACLRGGQSLSVVEDVEQRLKDGLLKVLLISPERLFTRRFRALVQAAGERAFSAVVVDEAHCISEWSHNFRTSYLRLSRVFFGGRRGEGALFKRKPRLLALTATATRQTTEGICQALCINPDDSVVRSSIKRDNLTLGVTVVRGGTDDAKAHELVRVLTTEPYATVLRAGLAEKMKQRKTAKDAGWGASARALTRKSKPRRGRKSDAGAVLIYVSKQRECANVCNFLRSSSLAMGRVVGMYHAGMGSHERSKTQTDFQEGRVCILIATVAFGMGLDVANVRAVIHYDLPFSLESYAQEVGRAGRDGKPAVCHALVSSNDRFRLVSRAYSDGVEPGLVRKFVAGLVESKKGLISAKTAEEEKPKGDDEAKNKSKDVESGCEDSDDDAKEEFDSYLMHIPISDLESEHDMRPEGAETVVAILERSIPGVELLPNGHARMLIQFFTETPEALLAPSHTPPLTPSERRILTAVVTSGLKPKGGVYNLHLATAGLLEEDVGRGLRRLSAAKSVQFEMKDMSLRVRLTGTASVRLCARAGGLASEAASRLGKIELARVAKAREVAASFAAAEEALTAQAQSELLHARLAEYFVADVELKPEAPVETGKVDASVRRAVGAVLGNQAFGRRAPRSPREVARIMHGIQSPAFTAKAWWSCAQWGKWVHVEFGVVKKIVAEVTRNRLKRGAILE